MLDVAPAIHESWPALLRVVDAMAFYKLNVLHLHLSDDQGFRLQSDAYPELASSESYGGSELRELVARAADRGIRVVPELDMPSHVAELASPPIRSGVHAGRSRRGATPRNHENDQAANVAKFPASRRREQAVRPPIKRCSTWRRGSLRGHRQPIRELAEIFPDPYVHMGGDEVLPRLVAGEPRSRWPTCGTTGWATRSPCRRISTLRWRPLAAGHGKRLIGWDEVLNGETRRQV